MAAAQFVHLRSRSPYSMLEGALRMGDTARRLAEMRSPALAITDTDNLCGALEFSETLIKQGIQPIMGITLAVDLGLPAQPGRMRRTASDGAIVLLAQNEAGWANLMRLASAAFLEVGAAEAPHVTLDAVLAHADGLIALTGGPGGALNGLLLDGRDAEAEGYLDRLQGAFGDRVYVELQRHGLAEEDAVEPKLLDLAYARGLGIVATNDAHFLERSMYNSHDALLAISEGSYVLEKNRRKLTPEHYLKGQDEMAALFADLPEAIQTSVDIARRCAFRVTTGDYVLPDFATDGEAAGEDEELARQAKEGLEQRLRDMTDDGVEPADTREAYFERLDYELGVITRMGFPGYFLIVSDFIKWAKAQGIPVGPGRGSGAGSVVAWALTITNLDPLRYGLLFERFLNPDRVSMPDFDIDFCQDRRGEVIEYVRDRYGHDQVAQIITFGTLQPRAVVRDLGRVMQMPLGQVDRLAKLVPVNPANPINLTDGLAQTPELQEARRREPAVDELFSKALDLEGLFRNASTHAAGVVIGDRPLVELVPLYRDPRSEMPATQYTMKWAEKAGLIKFDFLGLKTLTVIDRCLKFLAQRGVEVDLDALDPNAHPDAYAPLADGHSVGVFQLESSGMRDALRQLAPESMEELTAIISLYRPGPMRNIPMYVNRKFGRETVEYPHPSLEPILRETYGVIIYQEQVMQIAQVLSGYTLGEADLLRRAMGKKDRAAMAREKERFVEGAVKNSVEKATAEGIFELVNEFAGYGFNKSHAAAYALIGFHTAYLKAHYPAEFMAALMSLDIANVEKLAVFYKEAERMGVEIESPCVNRSGADFEVALGEGGKTKILYALGALKNVGVDAMRHVVEVRREGGEFKDLFDFAERVDTRIVNKRAFENLARGGAFDCLGVERAVAFANAGLMARIAAQATEERESAQVSLFGEAAEVFERPSLEDAEPWDLLQKLDEELGAVGLYLGGHPLDAFSQQFKARPPVFSSDLAAHADSGKAAARMVGIVRKRHERMGKGGRRFAFLALSDPSGDYEVMVYEEVLAVHRDTMKAGEAVELTVRIDSSSGERRLSLATIKPLRRVEVAPIEGLRIRLRAATPDTLDRLQKTLESLRGTPSQHSGYLEIVAPIDEVTEGRWRLLGRWGVDTRQQQAIKAGGVVETIDEVVPSVVLEAAG